MRGFLFFITFIFAVLLPLPYFLVASVLYAFLYSPLELFLIAIIIDAQYGEVGVERVWYVYTLWVSGLTILTEAVKPHLSIYNS